MNEYIVFESHNGTRWIAEYDGEEICSGTGWIKDDDESEWRKANSDWKYPAKVRGKTITLFYGKPNPSSGRFRIIYVAKTWKQIKVYMIQDAL